MTIENKIKELGLTLPKATDPVGSYLATKFVGKILYISGQISINEKGELIKGKLGKDLKTEDGYEAAKRCGLSIVSQVKKACGGDLSKVKSCIKLTGFVNSTEDFTEQPKALTINPQKGITILYIKGGLIKITINKIGPIKIKVVAAKK